MRKFLPSVRFLNRVNGLHSLLTALAMPELRVVLPAKRASSCMFLDMGKFSQTQIRKIITQAERLGLVKESFSNPYFLGRGENFVGLTKKGADLVDGVKHGS